MIVLAHAGHWVTNLLYLLPIVTMIGALALAKWRDSGTADQTLTDREETDAPSKPERPSAD